MCDLPKFSEFLNEMARPSKFSTKEDIAKAIDAFDSLPASKKAGVAVTILRNAEKLGYDVRKPEILKYEKHRENMDKSAMKKTEIKKDDIKDATSEIESLDKEETGEDKELTLKPGYDEIDFAEEFDEALDEVLDEIIQAKGSILISDAMEALANDIGITMANLKKILKGNSKYMSSNNDIYAIIKGEPMKRTTYQVTMAGAINKLKSNKNLKDQWFAK